jgi:hypothetical protein
MQWKRKTALGGDGVGQTSVWREGGWEGSEGEARAAAADQIARTTGHGLEQAPLALPVDLGERREVVLPPLWDDEAAVG